MPAESDQKDIVLLKSKNEMTIIYQQFLHDKEKFEDDTFLPEFDSIWYSKDETNDELSTPKLWKRLSEIVKDPVIMEKTDSQPLYSLFQGKIGTRYLLESLILLYNKYPEELKSLFLESSSHDCCAYALGLYQNMELTFVAIDDFVPAYWRIGCGHSPLYGECLNRSEVWYPLIEKAYAKMHGYYEHIHGGSIGNTLIDLTGGSSRHISLDDPAKLLDDLHTVLVYKGTSGGHDVEATLVYRNGIISGGGIEYRVEEGQKENFEFLLEGTFVSEGDDLDFDIKIHFIKAEYCRSFKGKVSKSDNFLITGKYWPDADPLGIKEAKWELIKSKRKQPLQTFANEKFLAFHDFWNFLQLLFSSNEQVLAWAYHTYPPSEKTHLDKKLSNLHPEVEEMSHNGLKKGVCYQILDVITHKEERLLKMFSLNLYGTKKGVWTGKWSPNDPESTGLYPDDVDPHIFYIELNDFLANFLNFDYTRMFPTSAHYTSLSHTAYISAKQDMLHYRNPKFKLDLRKETRITIQVQQPNTKIYEGLDHFPIGIGFQVILETTKFQAPTDESTCLVIADVKPIKTKQVSIDLVLDNINNTYNLTKIYGGHGCYYIVPYLDNKTINGMPVFVSATCDQSFKFEPVKSTTQYLPKVERNEVYRDEIEKWYWEERDQWEDDLMEVEPEYFIEVKGQHNKYYHRLLPETMEKSLDYDKEKDEEILVLMDEQEKEAYEAEIKEYRDGLIKKLEIEAQKKAEEEERIKKELEEELEKKRQEEEKKEEKKKNDQSEDESLQPIKLDQGKKTLSSSKIKPKDPKQAFEEEKTHEVSEEKAKKNCCTIL